jgi:hypothetical protein
MGNFLLSFVFIIALTCGIGVIFMFCWLFLHFLGEAPIDTLEDTENPIND